MYIFGAGAFGRETCDAVLASHGLISGFISDAEPDHPVPYPILTLEEFFELEDGEVVIAVSDPVARFEIARRLDVHKVRYGSVAHPLAGFGSEVSQLDGSIVLGQTFISTNAHLGRHAHINYGVTLGHDSVAEDFVTVLPNATIGGGVRLGSRVTIGSGAVILPRLTIGEGSVVGAGAVVTKNVEPGTVVVGVPARVLRTLQNHS